MVPPVNQKTRLPFALVTLLAAIFCFVSADCYCAAPRYVRVAIFQNISSLRLKVNGSYEIVDSASNKVLSRGLNLNTTVTAYDGGIMFGNGMVKSGRVFVRPYYPESVVINGRIFRGDIQLINSDMKLSVINYIELEDYVKGISIRETSHYWPADSLKAEVIVFRTFALYKMQENAGKDFDLTSDIYSQVYSGRAAERYRINKAVDETRGLVLTYGGKLLPAFYHAACGGHTEDASMYWKIDMAPLKGVPCEFCQDSPHYKWHNVLTEKEVRAALAKAGYKIDAIKDIVILGRDKSGRITDLKIITGKKDLKISAKDFRNILGPNEIKSTNFQVKIIDRDIVFEGFGWGHGVGLCQWGAYFMAKEGYTYKQILEYYYPGSQASLLPNN